MAKCRAAIEKPELPKRPLWAPLGRPRKSPFSLLFQCSERLGSTWTLTNSQSQCIGSGFVSCCECVFERDKTKILISSVVTRDNGVRSTDEVECKMSFVAKLESCLILLFRYAQSVGASHFSSSAKLNQGIDQMFLNP